RSRLGPRRRRRRRQQDSTTGPREPLPQLPCAAPHSEGRGLRLRRARLTHPWPRSSRPALIETCRRCTVVDACHLFVHEGKMPNTPAQSAPPTPLLPVDDARARILAAMDVLGSERVAHTDLVTDPIPRR